MYFVIYSRFYFDIVLCLFCAVTQQNVARRQHRITFTMHLHYTYTSRRSECMVCGWVFHFVAVILCDILCWPGICRAARGTERFTRTFASGTERGSNASFGIRMGISGSCFGAASRERESRWVADTSRNSNATDAVLRAHCHHHIYGYFFRYSASFFLSRSLPFFRLLRLVRMHMRAHCMFATRLYTREWWRRQEMDKVNAYIIRIFVGKWFLLFVWSARKSIAA